MKCSEEDCIADFILRRDTRLKYPGACSLEFQSVMQIFTECLLKWDIKTNSSTGRGILGTIIAFFAADEEQARKTLHGHWQIWIKEMNQILRNALFDNDPKTRSQARKKFNNFIDESMSASFDAELVITHNCINNSNNEQARKELPNNIFKEKDPDSFRQARNKNFCNDINGGIMFCGQCNDTISTVDIVNQSLKRWKDDILTGIRAQDNRPDTNLPISQERLDMASYLHSYHMDGGCVPEKDKFWGDKNIRHTLLKYRFEEHSNGHRASCFKKGCECRFLFPFLSSSHTYIHEDKGENDDNEIAQYFLDGSVNKVYPFMVIPKRPMGCQYINTHNAAISEVFNCNSNIQIGDASQVFYSTLYTSKSTQDEDSEQQLRIARSIIKRMKRLLEETQTIECDQITLGPSFGEGLSRVLSGLNAATTRNVQSSTMAHLITCQNGSRFVYSHMFSNLLVTQMEATLENHPTNVRIRTSKSKTPGEDGQCWPDSLADDYIYRPEHEEFENSCFYQMTREYKKKFKKLKAESIDKFWFSERHPGHAFSHLCKLKCPTIPKISLPPNKMCSVEELELNNKMPTEETSDKREWYAKMALLMFYPYRSLGDLKICTTYWSLFCRELQLHLEKQKHTFWSKGFEILQNMEDRSNIQKHIKRARDPISLVTNNKQSEETNKNNSYYTNTDQVADILEMGNQSR